MFFLAFLEDREYKVEEICGHLWNISKINYKFVDILKDFVFAQVKLNKARYSVF